MQDLFYNLNELSSSQLKKFFKEAINCSYNVYIQKLESWTREYTHEYHIGEIVNSIQKSEKSTCVWRTLEDYGEICYSTLEKPYIFLYIFVSTREFYQLVDKWELTPIKL